MARTYLPKIDDALDQDDYDYEDDVAQSHSRRKGNKPIIPSLGCRSMVRTVFWLILVFIIFAFYLFIFRPEWAMNPIKSWLNDGLGEEGRQEIIYDKQEIYDQINSSLKGFQLGDNDLLLTKQQLHLLIKGAFPKLIPDPFYLNLDDDKLEIYWDVEADTSKPLWLTATLSSGGGENLQLSRVGFRRLSSPDFLKDIFLQFALSGIQLNSEDEKGLIRKILPLPANVQVKAIIINSEGVTLKLDLSSGLDNIFEQNE